MNEKYTIIKNDFVVSKQEQAKLIQEYFAIPNDYKTHWRELEGDFADRILVVEIDTEMCSDDCSLELVKSFTIGKWGKKIPYTHNRCEIIKTLQFELLNSLHEESNIEEIILMFNLQDFNFEIQKKCINNDKI